MINSIKFHRTTCHYTVCGTCSIIVAVRLSVVYTVVFTCVHFLYRPMSIQFILQRKFEKNVRENDLINIGILFSSFFHEMKKGFHKITVAKEIYTCMLYVNIAFCL